MGLIFFISLCFLFLKAHGISDFDPSRVTQLSWSPRVFLYKGFLSHEECDHLISLAKDKLEKSIVVEDGENVQDDTRTSSGMFLNRHQDDVVTRIERRIAAWTFLPEENGEGIQVLRYEIGQKYVPHVDYFTDKVNIAMGGHRVATVLMYLSNVEKGGETVFPHAKAGSTQEKDESWSDCARKGYAVKPEKGDAVLFFSLRIDATPDQASLHESCPVIVGEKWSATKWIHVNAFDVESKGSAARECADNNFMCHFWAAAGECKKNPGYMVGDKVSPGFCLKSCRVCVP